MLPKVSRTFAACIGLLSPRLRRAVLISYLLCRIADTVEDDPGKTPEEKARLLAAFRDALDRRDCAVVRAAFAGREDDDGLLARHCDRVLRCFAALPGGQRRAVRPWVREMCDGMAWFARTYGAHANQGGVAALADLGDLDRYCYYVAGTVGHLLTELFDEDHRRLTTRHYHRLKRLATSFGLGLQMTNIIKDVADDAARGWSFVPQALCSQMGMRVEDLLDPERAGEARAVMAALIARAEEHLDDACEYCTWLPRSQYRVRLFCLTPLFFAIRTLRQAERDPRLLDPAHKVKISRAQVHRTLRTSALVAIDDRFVRCYYRHLRARPWV